MPKREDIVVVADGSAGRPAPEAFEVLGFASRLCCLARTSVQVWILGKDDDADALAGEIVHRGGRARNGPARSGIAVLL
jgi:hypothetical protein